VEAEVTRGFPRVGANSCWAPLSAEAGGPVNLEDRDLDQLGWHRKSGTGRAAPEDGFHIRKKRSTSMSIESGMVGRASTALAERNVSIDTNQLAL
jgi:hypothetical protein